jgi:PilZ domain
MESCQTPSSTEHTLSVHDRRREPRHATSGEAQLTVPDGRQISARLLDISDRGLRVEYEGAGVRSATEVAVTTSNRSFTAKVAWSMTSGSTSQSGMYICD